jgi:hypothetical protein
MGSINANCGAAGLVLPLAHVLGVQKVQKPYPPTYSQIRAYTKTDCNRMSSPYPGRKNLELGKFVVASSKTLAKTPSKSISDRKNGGNPLMANAARMRLDSMAKGTQRVPFPCEYRNRHVHPISSHVTKSILLRAGIARWSRVAIFACSARLNTHLQ